MKKVQVTTLVLALAAIAVAYVLYTNLSNVEPGVNEGDRALDFTLPMREQEAQSLSGYEGDVVILNMWASWCEPCKDEMPELNDLHDDYQDEGLTVIALNMASYERSTDDAIEFLDEFDIDLPVMFDEEGEVADNYRAQRFPTTYVINRDQVIEQVIIGEVTYEQLDRLIAPLL
ncbi:TlpA disulfide reductase family protein [Salsuginibacillus kocurii]|uniref:TlpA disulfide reductase family protein n=1 Tax=Salsuginibacillus kocurii TaxID=427078 RepID=UPI00058CF2ED|nr:TlpA disulfide reductase family protein [Salsuginibacillus kocurii]